MKKIAPYWSEIKLKQKDFRMDQCQKKSTFDQPQRLSQIFIKEHKLISNEILIF